jgi:hypothetical protein
MVTTWGADALRCTVTLGPTRGGAAGLRGGGGDGAGVWAMTVAVHTASAATVAVRIMNTLKDIFLKTVLPNILRRVLIRGQRRSL